MEHEGLLQCSQETSTGPINPVHTTKIHFLQAPSST
jgi:hypothetical protein